MKEIYIIRHGETDFNRAGIVQGSGVNMSLNETGRLQASMFHSRYKDFPFDKVYVSALVRAQESVASFLAQLPYEILPELNEISWGIYEGKPEITGWKGFYKEMIGQWASGNLDFSVEGGESPNQLAERQRRAIQHILSREDEKKVLICMHGRAMKSFLCLLLGMSLSRMDEFTHRNLCLYQLEYDGTICRLLKSNDVSHLEQFGTH